MFRCSLVRVCPRRRISSTWTGTLVTCRTSRSSSSTTLSPVSDVNRDDFTLAAFHDALSIRNSQLSKHFLAPSALGRSPAAAGKDDPHALLVRAGYIRQAHAGVYHMLPLALRVQRRVEAALQAVLKKIGASEVSLSSLSSEALWRRSGRIDQPLDKGQHEFMTVQDRKKSGFILSPTHEEEITNLVSDMTNSYKDFPLRLYQISRKYRDELRPRQGLLRTKEFLMKDLYTFDISEKAALDTYQSVRAAYRSFFDALGVPYVEVEASSGNMGGSLSHEYHFLSALGEDTIVVCESCGFAANEEILEKKPEGQDGHQCPRCTSNKVSSHRAIEVGHTFHLGTRYTEPLNAFVNIPRISQPEDKTAEDKGDRVEKIVSQDSSTDRVPLQMGCHGIGVSRLIGAVAAMTADEKGLSWPPLMAPAHVAIVFDGPAPPEHPEHPGRTPDYGYISRRISGIGYTGCWGAVGGLDIVFDDRDKPLPWKLKDADLIGYPVIVVLGKNFIKTGEYEIQCRSSKQLSVSSKHLTLSVATMMNELAAEARGDKCWDILSSSKYMPKDQLKAWKGGDTPKAATPKVESKAASAVPAAGENRDAVVVPGSDRLLEQGVGGIGRDKVKSGLESSPRLRKVITACQTCGKRHDGPCIQCATCGKRHDGSCWKRPGSQNRGPSLDSSSDTLEKKPHHHQPIEAGRPTNSQLLSHEHLAERISLLERLLALKTEEDVLRKRNGNR